MPEYGQPHAHLSAARTTVSSTSRTARSATNEGTSS